METESQMTGGSRSGRSRASVVVRQLSVHGLQETASKGDPNSIVSTLTLQPGEVRGLVAVVGEHGEVQGWVEAKRTAEKCQKQSILTQADGYRSARLLKALIHRPVRAAAMVPSPPTVTFANEGEEIPDVGDEAGETRETLVADNTSADTATETTKKKRSTARAGAQGQRRFQSNCGQKPSPSRWWIRY